MAARRGKKPPTPPPEPEIVEPSTPEPPPEIYGRVIFMVPYKSQQFIQRIQSMQEQINCQTLQLEFVSRSALASRTLTEEELANPELDIITGFIVMDRHYRLFVLEGLAEGGIKQIQDEFVREIPNGNRFKQLSNRNIKFGQRLYIEFGGDLKRIKLIQPLKTILMDPNIYIRAKVSEELQDVLNKIMEIRRADRLKHVKEFNLCPTASQLYLLERKYGDALTNEDLYGAAGDNRGLGSVIATTVDEGRSVRFQSTISASHQTGATKSIAGKTVSINIQQQEVKERTKLKADLDQNNEQYEMYLKQRQENKKNFIADNLETIREKSAINSINKPKDWIRPDPGDGEVYIYSGQKLNYTEHLKRQLALQAQQDKNNMYTLHKDYLSQSFPMVDEEEMKKQDDRRFTNTRLRFK